MLRAPPNAASEVSIRDLRELHRKDEELIARVTAQRDDAFTKAKTAPAPWLSDEMSFRSRLRRRRRLDVFCGEGASMREVTLTRVETSDEGTFGELITDGDPVTGCKLQLVTGELPWRDRNGDGVGDPLISCITAGTYVCTWSESSRFRRWLYRLSDVKGRDGILIHAGNFVGDKLAGKRCDVLGCILVGMKTGYQEGQKIVEDSRRALELLEKHFGHQRFELTIVDRTGT
jgi:hypothetical protein